jgi:hypothetical protein
MKFLLTGECRESFVLEDSQHRSKRLDATMHNGLHQPHECVTFDLGPRDAKDLGEWLVAWAREHAPECWRCKSMIDDGSEVRIGEGFMHRDCVDGKRKL